MCKAKRKLARFEKALELLAREGKNGVDFREACRRAHLSPASMDEILMQELGVRGSEIQFFY